MIYAYDKLYLSVAQKNLACMLDYMVNNLKYPLETAWQWFCMSNTASRFERGDCSIVAGRSGVEIAYEVLRENGKPHPKQTPSYSYNRSPEYWIGWAVAYYQWFSGRRYSDIFKAVTFEDLQKMYYTLHEADITKFAGLMDARMREFFTDTNLKRIRTAYGCTQAELAKRSQVSLRSIQMYEQRNKDINKASAETVLRLSRVLGCTMEDLLEK